MKFDMAAGVLTQLGSRTSTAHEDLGAQVHQLVAAAEPLEGTFNGTARTKFDEFKLETDEIARELNQALAAVLEGIQGQDLAFVQGEEEMAAQTTAAHSGSDMAGCRLRN